MVKVVNYDEGNIIDIKNDIKLFQRRYTVFIMNNRENIVIGRINGYDKEEVDIDDGWVKIDNRRYGPFAYFSTGDVEEYSIKDIVYENFQNIAYFTDEKRFLEVGLEEGIYGKRVLSDGREIDVIGKVVSNKISMFQERNKPLIIKESGRRNDSLLTMMGARRAGALYWSDWLCKRKCRRVMVLGQEGVGKSSLIKALKNKSGLVYLGTEGVEWEYVKKGDEIYLFEEVGGQRWYRGGQRGGGLSLVVYSDEMSKERAMAIGERVIRDGGKVIYVRNKIDLRKGLGEIDEIEGAVEVSARTGEGIDELWERIKEGSGEEWYLMGLDVLVEEMSGKYENGSRFDGAVCPKEIFDEFFKVGGVGGKEMERIKGYVIDAGVVETEGDWRSGKEVVILNSRDYVMKALMEIEEECDDRYDGSVDVESVAGALKITRLSALAYLRVLERMGYLIRVGNKWISSRWLIDEFRRWRGDGHRELARLGYKLVSLIIKEGEWGLGEVIGRDEVAVNKVRKGVVYAGEVAYVGYYLGRSVIVEIFSKGEYGGEVMIKPKEDIHYCSVCGRAFWLGGNDVLFEFDIEEERPVMRGTLICRGCKDGSYRYIGYRDRSNWKRLKESDRIVKELGRLMMIAGKRSQYFRGALVFFKSHREKWNFIIIGRGLSQSKEVIVKYKEFIYPMSNPETKEKNVDRIEENVVRVVVPKGDSVIMFSAGDVVKIKIGKEERRMDTILVYRDPPGRFI